MTGSQAAVEALRQMAPAVFAAYPITPQTPIIEGFADLVANNKAQTEFIAVESEHSAMSACIGAQAMGVRSSTASSSQGLILMHEMLHIASGLRLPITMNVAARALSSPINIHGDHSDVMNVRDSGWIQLFSENPQEVYDLNFIALKLAEKTMVPAMVVQDGFLTSHSVELLETLPDVKMKDFVGEYRPKNHLLDFEQPKTFGSLVLPDHFMEVKKVQMEAFDGVLKAFKEVAREYQTLSGRLYNSFEDYNIYGARTVIICLGSTAGTVKHYLREHQNAGVGLVKAISFRPFDYKALADLLKDVGKVIVLERTPYYGTTGPLTNEVYTALRELPDKKEVKSFVYGLGGADFGLEDLGGILDYV